jgi:hypothetical protein
MVWSESNLESARLSLRGALSSIRKVLPPNSILSIDSEVSLAANTVEIEPFEVGETHESELFPSGWNHPWVLKFRRSMAAPTGQPVAGRPTLAEGEEPAELFHVPSHPLAAAANYLLEGDPLQALELVASTRSHWGAIPLAESIEVHRRILIHCPTDSSSRRRVEAMAILLNALNGSHLGAEDRILAMLQREMREPDTENAVLILTALAIGAQQKGQLEKALRFGQIRARVLTKSHSPEARARGAFFVANMERHSGRYQEARNRNLQVVRAFEELGSLEDLALANLTASTDAILANDFSKAEAYVRQSQHLFDQANNTRLRPWSEMARAFLLESTGNLSEARTILHGLRDQGPTRSGQSFRAGVEDHLLRVDTKLGEWNDSATDWATAKQIRTNLGHIPSPFEKALSRPAKHLLRERIGVEDLHKLLSTSQSRT